MAIGIGVKIGSANSIAVAASEHSWENTVSGATSTLVDVDGFVHRVGDPVPMVDEHGHAHIAAEVYADAVAALLSRLEVSLDPDTDLTDTRLTVVHPDTWSDEAIAEARRHLSGRPGLPESDSTTWVTESQATLAAVEHSDGRFTGGPVVVYDLGASGLTVTVLATGDDPAPLGRPLRLDGIAGREFDRLLLVHALSVTGVAGALDDSASGDGDAIFADLNRLRDECRSAKEALSVDTDTTVDVRVGEVVTEARIVRDDIEDLLRGPIVESVALVREALVEAGVETPTASAVVLSGGGATIPLVTEMLSSTLRLPVVLDPEPSSASAAGGALLATARFSDRAASSPAATAALGVAAGNAGESEAGAGAASLDEPRPIREIIPAPSTPLTEPAPRMSRRKRGTLISLGTAALVLMTATGLSVGTGLVGSTGQATPPPAGAATSASSPAPDAASPGTATPATGAPGVVGTDDARGTTNGGAANGSEAGPSRAAGTGTADPRRAPGTSGRAPAPAPEAGADQQPPPAAPAPPAAPSNPAPPAPAPAPAPVPEQDGGAETPRPRPGGLLQVPGRILDGTGQVVCGVTGVIC